MVMQKEDQSWSSGHNWGGGGERVGLGRMGFEEGGKRKKKKKNEKKKKKPAINIFIGNINGFTTRRG